MTDVHKPNQRRSSTTYFALPLTLLRRRFSTQAHPSKISSPPSLNSTNDPLSEVIEIGQSNSTFHTYSHATDERSIVTPEDEERQRLRDAAAQSLGLDLNVSNDGRINRDDSVHYTPPSRPSSSSKTTGTHSYNHNPDSSPPRHSGLLSSFTVNSPSSIIYNPSSLSTNNKLPPYPCSYSDLAPFIQISSSYLKFSAPTDTHTSNGLAFISLAKRSKSVKPHWKLCYIVLTVPREYAHRSFSSPDYSFSSQSPQSNNFQPLASPTRFHARNSPPPSSSTFVPSHSHLHLFKSEHPARDEVEVDRLEINEDTVVYIADIELAGKKGLIKVTGRHVGANAAANDEELSRTLWILKYPDPRETTKVAPNHRIVYPDESEVQQRWVKEIKSSVLSQRAERAGFLHASSQPNSPRSSLLGNSGYPCSPTNNGWHLPISPNRQLSFFPQPRPPPPILPPPNPNPRYAEHVGAAPSANLNGHSPSRSHTPAAALKVTNLRSLFRSPSPNEVSSVSKDDNPGAIKIRGVSPVRNASRPSSRDGAGSVWSGISMGIQRTAIREEEKEDMESPQRKDIHPMAPDVPTDDYASFLTRLNTRFKESLHVKEKEKAKKDRRRPKSTGSMPESKSLHETSIPSINAYEPQVANQTEPSSLISPQFLHPFAGRPTSPPNEASVASIYSQSSAHTKETRTKGHGHTRSASAGTINTSLLNGKSVAEWIVSTTQAQAEGDVRNNDKRRSNERLSIGESLAISLSMNPPPKSQRRSMTINSFATSAIKEDWTFPASGSATVSDGTETPSRAHPHSHHSIAPSDATPPVPTQGPNLARLVHLPGVSPSVTPVTSLPPSVRNSVDFKPREVAESQSVPENERAADPRTSSQYDANESGNENENANKSEVVADKVKRFKPRLLPTEQAHSSSASNSTKSWFGHPTPPIYKRVSAPPAPLSATNSSNGLPPPRPPPSFAPPPPPSDHPYQPSSMATASSEALIASKVSINSVEKKTGRNVDGSDNAMGLIMSSSLPSRPFRLSLNPSPPPTQPLPPRPDEVFLDGTIAVKAKIDKEQIRQRHRPHSTLVGPRERQQKAFSMDGNERPLFLSMYPMSVSAWIPAGNSGSMHGDSTAPSGSSTVPAPQPPPQGPLPPTPGSNEPKETSTTSLLASPEGPPRSSIRRPRIMSSPPAPRMDNDTNDMKGDESDVMISREEMTEPRRSRLFIPAPPRMPPPKPQKGSSERVSSMVYVYDLSPEHSPPGPSPNSRLSALPSTFLHMDDTPKTLIFPSTAANQIDESTGSTTGDNSETSISLDARQSEHMLAPPPRSALRNSRDLRTSRGYVASQVTREVPIPEEPTPISENTRNINPSPDHHEIPVLINTDNGPNLTEVDIGTGATITIGRITPPSPPSPLSISAQTPSRTNSPSPLFDHSYLHYERSVESEGEEDSNY